MRRSTVLIVALVSGAALTGASQAAPKGVSATIYFHGGPNGNAHSVQAVATGSTGVLPMNATKPTSPADSDFGFGLLAGQPDTKCVGNPQNMFPTWTGAATGTLVNKLKVAFYARSLPGGKVTVRLFTDLPANALCGSAFPRVIASATIGLGESPLSRQHNATLILAKPIAVKKSFTLQFVPSGDAVPFQGSSIVFDSTTSPSNVTWLCMPKSGRKAC